MITAFFFVLYFSLCVYFLLKLDIDIGYFRYLSLIEKALQHLIPPLLECYKQRDYDDVFFFFPCGIKDLYLHFFKKIG